MKTKKTKKLSLTQKIAKNLDPRTKKGGVLLFMLVFAIVGGSYYAYKSFADSAQAYYYILPVGQCLNPGQDATLPDSAIFNNTKLTMQLDGNAVLMVNGVKKWSSETTGLGNKLCMNTSGSLSVNAVDGKQLWNSNSARTTVYNRPFTKNTYILSLIIRNQRTEVDGIGIVVLKSGDNYGNLGWVSYKRNTLDLWAGNLLTKGQSLVSADGSRKALLQTDGNLVVYNGNKPIWQSFTFGKSEIRTLMSATGSALSLLDSSGRSLWSEPYKAYDGRTDHAHRLVMQNDGNLVAYSKNGVVLWQTYTAGK